MKTEPVPTACPRCGSVTRPRNGLQPAFCARCGAALPKPAAHERPRRRRAGRVSAVIALGLAGAVWATQAPWVGFAAGAVLLLSALRSWRLDWIGTPIRLLALGLLLFGFVLQGQTRHPVPYAPLPAHHQHRYEDADRWSDHEPRYHWYDDDDYDEHEDDDEYNGYEEYSDYDGHRSHGWR